MGLDLEFGSADDVESIVLVQIATRAACLVYRPPDAADRGSLPPALVKLLLDATTDKLTIGYQDTEMMESCWRLKTAGVKDLQQRLLTTLRMPLKPGLERMVQAFLPHLSYVKDKALQRSGFEWPLSAEQTEYAASDAVLVLLLAEKLDDISLPHTKRLWEARSKAEALGNLPNGRDELNEFKQLQAIVRDGPLPEVSFFNRRLNQPQQEAVRGVCAGLFHPYPYIIFGPPGTGSTFFHIHSLSATSSVVC